MSVPSARRPDPQPSGATLRERGVPRVVVAGTVSDHGGGAQLWDAQREGVNATLLFGHAAGVAQPTTASALSRLQEPGAHPLDEPRLAD